MKPKNLFMVLMSLCFCLSSQASTLREKGLDLGDESLIEDQLNELSLDLQPQYVNQQDFEASKINKS